MIVLGLYIMVERVFLPSEASKGIQELVRSNDTAI
jgi:hypothetical protein